MLGARTTRSIRALVPIVSGVMLWTLLSTTMAIAADKVFSATLDGLTTDPLVAGAAYGGVGGRPTLQLKLTNNSTQAQLGSANVTVPTGVLVTQATASPGTVLDWDGNVIKLRNVNLPPGSFTTVSIAAQVQCGANPVGSEWSFVVKQANDFNGTGNDLSPRGTLISTIPGNCSVSYSTQPTSAVRLTTITGKAYDSSASAPKVQLDIRSADGVLVTWWDGTVELTKGADPSSNHSALLGGGDPKTVVDGFVTFSPTLDVSATGYSLIATAQPLSAASGGVSPATTTSDKFNIVDAAGVCTSHNSNCPPVESTGPQTKAKIEAGTGGSDNDVVVLAFNDPTVTVNCDGYVETSDVISYNVTQAVPTEVQGRAKLATLTLLAPYVTKAASKYDVCYQSTLSFPTKSGAQATLDLATGLYTGLLPGCVNKTLQPSPCVVSKALDTKTKNLVIVVSSPPGDPQAKF
jgi:hypothetical protein